MRVRAKAQLSCLADQILQLSQPKLRPAIQFAIALFTLQLAQPLLRDRADIRSTYYIMILLTCHNELIAFKRF